MNFMKILAIILSVSCIIDIFKPSVKVIKAFNVAKENGLAKEVTPFIISQILNIIALIFFITFIVKY